MKIYCRLFCLVTFLLVTVSRASEASDEYVSIYSLITKGDEMLGSGLRGEAAQFYSDAHRKLIAFRDAYPNWNQQVVQFRLKYLGEKLVDLPAIEQPPTGGTTTPGTRTASATPNLADEKRLLEGQVYALNEQMRQLTADNSLLLSKLRESMSARPAEVDPTHVRRAEAKILELEKENELIEIQLRRALNTKPAEASSEVGKSELRQAKKLAEQLRKDNQGLEMQVARLGREVNESIEAGAGLQRKLASVEAELRELKATRGTQAQSEFAQLQRDKERLTDRLKQTERELASQRSGSEGNSNSKLNAAIAERDRLQVALSKAQEGGDQQETLESLMRENAQLRRQIEDREGSVVGATGNNDEKLLKRISELEKENQKLTRNLAKQNRSPSRGRLGWLPRFGRRNSQIVSDNEARLAVLEADKEPFNSEELALLSYPDVVNVSLPSSVETRATGADTAQISQAAAKLEAEAQEAARQGAFAAAESKFNEILDLIPNHAPTLASLALTQLKQQKLGEAEANLELARKVSPENTYVLLLTGLLKMNQEKFDDAVTFLSRATVLDPDDAEAHNHLGVALTEVGHRGPAEAALRKAIRLRPGYGDAHVNLAVVYASQNPPFKELAKYHYQQAINSGHPADPRIEQMLSGE